MTIKRGTLTSTCTRVKAVDWELSEEATHQTFVRRSLGDARALPGTSILTSAASRGTVPRCRRTSRRLRDVPSSRFTTHRPSGATLQRRFGGSASNAPREQPTGNLDGRRIKCSTMMAAALHGQNDNYPPTHIPKSTRSPFVCAATPYNHEPPLAQRPERPKTPPRRRGAPGGNNLSRSFPLAAGQVRGLHD